MIKYMARFCKRCIRAIYYVVLRCVNLLKLVFQVHYYKSNSYFPEMLTSRKSLFRILFEQCENILKYGYPNQFYFLYGLDIKGFHKNSDFVDNTLFVTRRYKMDYNHGDYPPIPVLRDKALFGIVAEAYGIDTPINIGIVKDGHVYLFEEKNTIDISRLCDKLVSMNVVDFFVKKIDGECADGVYHIIIKNNNLLYKNTPINESGFFEGGNRYLIQKTITKQHPEISAIHSKAINTLRLVTVYNEKTTNIEVLSCVLRVGKGDNNVDNWAAGGLSIGVDIENGTLRKYGFYKPGYGTKATEHPDSHIVFEGYKIPYLQEAIEKAKEFHSHLYGIHSIGWDIAITEHGPCFVEGNDNWEISLMQISNHGLCKEFDNLFY